MTSEADNQESSSEMDQSSVVRRMADAIDDLAAETSISGDSARDVLACLALLSRIPDNAERAEWSSDGGDECEAPDNEAPELPFQLGQFEIREMLGHGGFGIVYRAFDTKLGREVALKLPLLESLAAPEARSRFLHEAQVAAVLDHPGIVPLYETGELGPLSYIACGLVRGPTLRKWLKDQPMLPACQVAVQIVRAVADAVQHAHERGVLHLDLKPSNVFLEPKGEDAKSPFPYTVKLGDFGLAGRTGSDAPHSRSFRVAGTLRYMSPEQARGERKAIGIASDVYGLGAVLFELLTGQPPFTGESDAEVLRRITAEEPPSISAARPDVPCDLEAICLKCLEKEPRARFSSVRDLADDLRRFLAGLPVAARRIGRIQRFARVCRRHPAVTGLAAAVVVSATAGILGIAYQWRQTQLHAAEARHQASMAIEQQKRAERHLGEAQKSLLDMAWMFQESSPFLVGEPHVLNELHAKLADYESQLAEGKASPEVRLPVVAALSTFAALAHMDDNETTGPVHAVQFHEAADRWREVVRKWPDRPTYRRALMLHLLSTAEYYRRTGKNEEAKLSRDEAQKALAPPWTGTDADAPACVDMATRLDDLAGTLRRAHREDDARCLKAAAVTLLAHVRTMLPHDTQILIRWANAQCRLAADLEQGRQGDPDAMLAVAERNLASVYDSSAPELELGLVLADVLRRQATIARDRKDREKSLALFKKADNVLNNLEAAHSRTPSYRVAKVPVLRGLGYVQLSLGDKDAAFATMNRCRQCFREAQMNLELRSHEHIRYGRVCADAGTLAIDRGKKEEAEKCFAEAIESFERASEATRWLIPDVLAYAESTTMLARIREEANQPNDAQPLYERALTIWQKLSKRAPRNPVVKQRLALVGRKLAGASASVRLPDEAPLKIDTDASETEADEP